MFLVPIVAGIGTAIGSAVGAVGTAIGGLLGAGTAAGAAGGIVGSAAPVVGGAANAAGILGTGLSGWQALSLGGTLLSGVTQMMASSQQAAAYQMQATNSLIAGQQQALEYKRQGIAVLNRTIETSALVNARAGAGGIDPFSGSPSTLTDYAMNKGVDEYMWTRDNAKMSILSGQGNYAAYMAAADSASTMGMVNLLGSGLTGITKLKALG